MKDFPLYDVVVGVEIHTELDTESKIFCGCKKAFGAPANTHTCPICLGLPGAMPSLNQKSVELAVRAGLSIDSQINEISIFDRKNYFYQDLSKGYQISQVFTPICVGGGLKLNSGKFIRVHQIHLEEDTGKILNSDLSANSLIDYNRCGIGLIELVTEPDFASGEEVAEFISKLRQSFIYAGVSTCIMEEGEMRCDVNISVKKKEDTKLGTRVELKNVNSFKAIIKAVEYEAARHIELIESGKQVTAETRRWDENLNKSVAMRKKAASVNYRVFEDPELLRLKVSRAAIDKIKTRLPTLPKQWREKFSTYGLGPSQCDLLIDDREHIPYYEECVSLYNNPLQIYTWLFNDGFKIKNESGAPLFDIPPKDFVEIIKMVNDKKITRDNGVKLMRETFTTKKSPSQLAASMGLFDTVKTSEIEKIIREVFSANLSLKADYLLRPERVEPFIIGQVMKHTQGKAKSEDVKTLIQQIKDEF